MYCKQLDSMDRLDPELFQEKWFVNSIYQIGNCTCRSCCLIQNWWDLLSSDHWEKCSNPAFNVDLLICRDTLMPFKTIKSTDMTSGNKKCLWQLSLQRKQDRGHDCCLHASKAGPQPMACPLRARPVSLITRRSAESGCIGLPVKGSQRPYQQKEPRK